MQHATITMRVYVRSEAHNMASLTLPTLLRLARGAHSRSCTAQKQKQSCAPTRPLNMLLSLSLMHPPPPKARPELSGAQRQG